MCNIEFKDIRNQEIIKFENINLLYDDIINRITFDLILEFDFFRAKTQLEAEESDFVDLIKNLKKIYERKACTFVFNPIGEQFKMRFSFQENGYIKVLGKLSNSLFTGNLEFEYSTDQSFIPELIMQIETTIIR